MRIERVNENVIRCYISKDDLDARHINISELSYGSEKAKDLFSEVMQWANSKFNFDTDGEPLMIEAVPVNSDTLILIVSKVSYPEELDSRFSDFSDDEDDDDFDFDYDDMNDDEVYDDSPVPSNVTSAHDVLRQYALDRGAAAVAERPKDGTDTGKAPAGTVLASKSAGKDADKPASENDKELVRLVSFDNLDDVINIAPFINSIYHGRNDLYKDDEGYYLLLVRMEGETPVNFNKVCNILTEFSEMEQITPGTENFIDEHTKPLIKDNAIKVLSEV